MRRTDSPYTTNKPIGIFPMGLFYYFLKLLEITEIEALTNIIGVDFGSAKRYVNVARYSHNIFA
jgi:hypothetical protein